MRILFIAHHKWPHIGGVEKHMQEVSKSLERKGNKVKIISEEDIKYPHVKLLGLLYIWYWFFKNRKMIQNVDVVHIHDVFIWYLPFCFLYPKKPVYITFHGWEGVWPIPGKNIFYKRLAAKLSKGSIAVGYYIEKYYGVKADKIIYGGTTIYRYIDISKRKNTAVFVGRLERDTGVLKFTEWLKKNPGKKAEFIGDGSLRGECEKYGKVCGFCDPIPFFKKAEYAVPAGYLSYIEAKSFGCKIIVYPNNSLKKDYWKEIEKVKKFPTWGKIADEYLSLYNNTK